MKEIMAVQIWEFKKKKNQNIAHVNLIEILPFYFYPSVIYHINQLWTL